MLQQPLRLCVMVRDVEPPAARESRLLVATAAEQFRVMTGRALGFAAPGIRGMPLCEVRRMKAALVLARVTVRAKALLVATFARE
jgi:hypothetical protein